MSLRRWSVDLASVAAGLLGSLTNSAGGSFAGAGVAFGATKLPDACPGRGHNPAGNAEAILAAVVTVVLVRGVMLIRSGRATAPETGSDEERRY